MSANRSIIGLTALILGGVLLVTSVAAAEGRGRSGRSVARVDRSPVRLPSRALGGGERSSLPRLDRSAPSLRLPSSLGNSDRSRSRNSNYGHSSAALGDLLGALSDSARRYGDYYGYGSRDGYYGPFDRYYDDRNRAISENAKAYRDVGIANAVVDLFGVIANSAVANQGVRTYASPPVYGPPPPAYCPPPQPAGHYERRQVVVQEGYYEQYQVWVPDYQDPRSREVVAGHYETHSRWVPPVYGYQDVWVP